MFKEKSSKKRIVSSESAKDHTTLDARHQQVIQNLQERSSQIEQLEAERALLQEQLAVYRQHIASLKAVGDFDSQQYDDAWSSNLHLQECIGGITSQIDRHKSYQEEIDYYENTGYILFQYYDLLRNQGNCTGTSTNTNMHTATASSTSRNGKGRKKAPPPPSKSILDAFGCTSAPSNPDASNKAGDATKDSGVAGPVMDKSTLVDEYLACMDSNYLRPIALDALGVCMRCHHELVCMQQEGTMVCPSCGYQELLLVEQNRPLLRQISKEASSSHQSYKRINHFREWCSQVQGRESTDIPEEVFEMILQEIKKEKITDPKRITYNKMREILKRLRINKFYEHIHYLIRRICNIQTPYFSPELEDKLCSMFKEIQPSFVRHCPQHRKNFLSYSYVLYKFFQILGQQDKQYLEYCKYFMLLKSREKLYVQDQIFKAICEDLSWPVIPTL